MKSKSTTSFAPSFTIEALVQNSSKVHSSEGKNRNRIYLGWINEPWIVLPRQRWIHSFSSSYTCTCEGTLIDSWPHHLVLSFLLMKISLLYMYMCMFLQLLVFHLKYKKVFHILLNSPQTERPFSRIPLNFITITVITLTFTSLCCTSGGRNWFILFFFFPYVTSLGCDWTTHTPAFLFLCHLISHNIFSSLLFFFFFLFPLFLSPHPPMVH